MNISPADMHDLLASAILAPSADNHHPIRFFVEADRVIVYYTGPKLAENGYKRALTLLSLGTMVENLVIAASHLDREADIRPFPDPAHPEIVLTVHLRPAKTNVDPLWPYIPLRHTNRRVFFHGPGLSAPEKGSLEKAVLNYSGCRLQWLDERTVRRHALTAMRKAETERFSNRLLHEEMFSAIRFEVGWHVSTDEGLPPGALGVEAPLRPFFALLRHWPIMRVAKLLGMHYLLGWRACYLPCLLAPNLAVLTVSDVDSPSLIRAGRAWQRIWLELTRLGRVLQPLPASAIYAMKGSELEGVPLSLQRSLTQVWKHLLGDTEHPVAVFRIGFARPHDVHTARRPLAEYLNDATRVAAQTMKGTC